MAVGEEERRAQSRGEWPGVRRTFLRGFAGTAECVGGGAREKDALVGVRLGSWTGERRGGVMRPPLLEDLAVGRGESRGGVPVPPVVLCAELRDGKRGGADRVPLARCAEFAAGKEGPGGEEVRVKVGAVGVF